MNIGTPSTRVTTRTRDMSAFVPLYVFVWRCVVLPAHSLSSLVTPFREWAPQNCTVSAWSAWSGCTGAMSCNGASETRSRTITKPPLDGGNACPPLTESRVCSAAACGTLVLHILAARVRCCSLFLVSSCLCVTLQQSIARLAHGVLSAPAAYLAVAAPRLDHGPL